MAERDLAKVAAVVGVGHSDWIGDHARVRAGGKPHDSNGYGAVAFREALADAGIDRSEIDGLIVGPTTSYERIGELLGLNVRWGGQADAMLGIIEACMAIRSGLAEVVALVYGNDQRSAAISYGGAEAMGGNMFLSYVYHAPWGFTSQGALYAMMFRRYMELEGLTEAELGEVAVAQRLAASKNPNALMRKPITVEDYLNSAYICEPLHLFDYCLINDGGVALIVAEAGRAKRMSARSVPIHGVGRSDLNAGATSLEPRLFDYYRPAQQQAAEQVFAMAGAGPSEMSALQVYDSFSCHIPLALEGYGYCRTGEAGRFMREHGISLAKGLPVNTSGGHLSESYMQGWNHQVEAVRQMRGECGARQVPDCRFVHYSSDVAGKAVSIIYGK
ncbi:thiolase family protein [Bosea caraganae]|uniref:Thiolase family protein n=1 Tax=Bosea caraganae TaxID=2763117 RepID=A0A370KXS6_9HYPH|nr:thiolase family protein [Bosea caraganae]RDJ19781.1 thiolase family protein [Bosea caraganae]RDJ21115.1 thiolase family protein [Bosea caraganae]